MFFHYHFLRGVVKLIGFIRETKQKTLEEIAAAFGDRVMLVTDTDIAAEEAVMEDKVTTGHVETAEPMVKDV